MDTSKEYIKMCEKAEEIQHHNWKNRDYIYNPNWSTPFDIIKKEYLAIGMQGYLDNCIWFPRQDQLQEMVFTNPDNTINIQLHQFYAFGLERTYKVGYCATACFDTWEQLWLAFVMKEKYHKVWNGKEWAKQ